MNRPTLGLRGRLLIVFALLSVITTAAVAGGGYVKARDAILQRAQDAAVQAMTNRLETLFPLRGLAPGPMELGEIAGAVTDRNSSAVALYRGAHSQTGLAPEVIPPELRRAVAGGDIAWQRVELRGVPTLIIGTPLLTTGPDRTTRASGIEVYTARDLLAEEPCSRKNTVLTGSPRSPG